MLFVINRRSVLFILDVIQRADAEADMDFFTADLQVEFGVETAQEKTEGNAHFVAVNVHNDVRRTKNVFGFVKRSQKLLKQAEFGKQLAAESVFAVALAAFDGILACCIEDGEAHQCAAIFLDATEFKFTAKLQEKTSLFYKM